MNLRRKGVSIYFLLTSIPFGLCAIYADLIIIGDLSYVGVIGWENVVNDFWRYAGELGLLILINFGLLLLGGYFRFLFSKKPINLNLANCFWGVSLGYNAVLIITESIGHYPTNLRYLLLFLVIPIFALILSFGCLELPAKQIPSKWTFAENKSLFIF